MNMTGIKSMKIFRILKSKIASMPLVDMVTDYEDELITNFDGVDFTHY